MPISVIFADDHPMLLSGLAYIVSKISDFKLVGLAKNSTQIFELLSNNECDVLVTDYSMPGGKFGDGLGMLASVRRFFPKIKIIVLTVIDERSIVSEINRLGVKILNKRTDTHLLMEAIRSADSVTKALTSSLACEKSPNPLSTNRSILSPREIEVVRLYIQGSTTSQIAKQLNRTIQTVCTQKASAMKKLGFRTDLDLFRFAHKEGMLLGSTVSSPSTLDSPDVQLL